MGMQGLPEMDRTPVPQLEAVSAERCASRANGAADCVRLLAYGSLTLASG
jgi:hypothetical protein